MGILSNAPQGFAEAVSMLNALPQSLLAEMAQDVMAFLQYNTGFINIEDHRISIERINATEVMIKAESCINALTYIFRSAAVESLSSEDFVTELKSSLLFQDSSLAVIKTVWKTEGPSLCSLPKQSLSVGELFSMDWTLGVALSSSSCRTLNTPHLNLQLRVAENRDEVKIKNIEMSLSEFQNFATQLKEISNALDTA